MIGRTDVFPDATCLSCNGSGRDRKKRSRKCPDCSGSGKALVCRTCGGRMPCVGTRSGIMDQGTCMGIEIEVTTLKSTGKTLKIPTGKPDPDAPLTGPFGMVITKTKCPSCGSEDLDTVAKASTKGWGRRCQSCEAIWGVDEATDDSPGLVHVHTGEAVRQLMEANSGD